MKVVTIQKSGSLLFDERRVRNMSPAMETEIFNLRNNTNMKHSSIAGMYKKSIRNMERNICFQFLILGCIHNGEIIKSF
jgi:hypothetical protein